MILRDECEEDASKSTLYAESQNRCFVCGQQNPNGLHIRFEPAATGEVTAAWIPRTDWEGFRGIVHGGVVSTVLDEAMSKAVIGLNYEALTAELRVRFRHHVRAGEQLSIRGWVVKRDRRVIRTEATLTAADGSERAHGWASFLTLTNSNREKP